ncbi:exodeoxyribonuclease VII small subunit [Legionella londiniensis]|uniref:Exodeoxyribonuclease 7 small subunit n=1 Tax=Legionella londiniensis TaxID=45068 RepID=A0A0W0VQ84_9GAMM|nr:exodeoxyribonuclease VII small subunit [Legionella londiniensis]KTD21910.1 exodeoxyribonuclease VII small subunit [Legionella londiniensis]STX92607.1 exodeoxyribonuclease VII small subunit [Legionella londiniensis]
MTKTMQFEKTIAELETIVSQLEKGDLSLEESLKQFEKGITLARKSQEILSKAEQKVELLTASNFKDLDNADE